MSAVYHIFVAIAGSWRWAATVPEPLTHDDTRRLVEHLHTGALGAPVRITREENAPIPTDRSAPGATGET